MENQSWEDELGNKTAWFYVSDSFRKVQSLGAEKSHVWCAPLRSIESAFQAISDVISTTDRSTILGCK